MYQFSRKVTRALLLTIAIIAVTACERAPEQTPAHLAVASSLTDWVESVASTIEPKPRLSISGSQMLRIQIENGARPDLFISANHEHAKAVAALDEYNEESLFLCNRLVLAYSKSRYETSPSLADLLQQPPTVAIADDSVPAGKYARQLMTNLREGGHLGDSRTFLDNVISHDLNVRQVLRRVSDGEADVGFVYSSGAMAAKDSVGVVPLPEDCLPVARYYTTFRSDSNIQTLTDVIYSDQSSHAAESLGFFRCDR
jgi:molybdate transport system substrate-binding protein